MNQIVESPSIQEIFPLFEKISHQTDGHLAQIQNDVNHQRFVDSLSQSAQEVEYIFNQLQEIPSQQDSLLSTQIINFSELINKLHNLQQSLNLPYMLYVIGMGNAGKSSLLNSLVGSNVAEVDVLPKTWKTDLFFKAENANNKPVKFSFRDNRPDEFYDIDKAKKLIAQEEEKREESEDLVENEYRKEVKAKNLTHIEEKTELRKELQDKHLYRSPIREVHWALTDLEDSTVLDKFSLIDTPGLAQSNAGTHDEDGVRGEDIGDFYHQADGVLWVLDATVIASSTPKKVLDNLDEYLTKTNANHQGIHNIIAVLNYSDKIIKQEGQEVLDKVVQETKKIFGNKFLDVVPYSAKQAMEAIKNNDSALLESSGYNNLCKVTNQHFYYNAVNLRIQSKKLGFSGEIFTYQSNFFQPYIQRLKADYQKLQDRLKKADKDLEHLKQQLENEWNVNFSEYRKIVENNIRTYASQVVEMSSSQQKTFMEKNVFRLDLLKEYQSKYHKSSIKKLSETMKIYRKYDTKNFTKYKYIKNHPLDIKTGNIIQNTTSIQQLNISDIDSESLFIGGGAALIGMALLGPIGIAAGLLGMMFGKSKEDKAKDSMRDNLDNLENNCLNENQKFINSLFDKAIPMLQQNAEDTFTNLHTKPNKVKQVITHFESLNHIKSTEFQKATFAHLLF